MKWRNSTHHISEPFNRFWWNWKHIEIPPEDHPARWYCVETAQPSVKLSSLPGNPMILVFWGPNLSQNPNGDTPNAGVKCNGVAKSSNFRPISRYSSYKRLNIDGYMLLCVWLALNPLSVHVTFTAIVPLVTYLLQLELYIVAGE